MKVEINSRVENGRLKTNRAALNKALQEFEGKEIVVSISKRKSKRSNPQNRYYWGAVIPIVRDCLRDAGHRLTIEDTHLMLRGRFLTEAIHLQHGDFIDQIRSTSSLSKSEFSDYIEDIRSFMQEYFNTDIPEANTQTEIQWTK